MRPSGRVSSTSLLDLWGEFWSHPFILKQSTCSITIHALVLLVVDEPRGVPFNPAREAEESSRSLYAS